MSQTTNNVRLFTRTFSLQGITKNSGAYHRSSCRIWKVSLSSTSSRFRTPHDERRRPRPQDEPSSRWPNINNQQKRGMASAGGANSNQNPLGLEDESSIGGSGGDAKSNKFKDIVLFERKVPISWVEKSSFLISCTCTAFFIWYTVDFVPAMNNSGIPDLYINPVFPGLGLSGALLFQVGSTFFPRRFITKLSLRKQLGESASKRKTKNQLVVYCRTLPFQRPAQVPTAVFPLGDVGLQPSSERAFRLANLDDILKVKGYFPLFPSGRFSIIPYVLLISEPDKEIREPTIFLPSIIQGSQEGSDSELGPRATRRRRQDQNSKKQVKKKKKK